MAVQRFLKVSSFVFLLSALAIEPAAAQFSGLLRSAPRDAANDAQREGGCEKGKSSTEARVVGGLIGRMAGRAASSAGISSWVPIPEFADQLTSAIACRLDPKEQKQAADATLKATRSDGDGATGSDPVPVGSTAEWSSESRPEVSGSSTVAARDASADGGDCITVTDVVIVKGEETRADKRMCRPAGSRRYSLVT